MEALVLIFGTYAITLALTESQGPWGLFYKLRKNKHVDSFGLLNCHICTALWVAMALGLILGHVELVLLAWGVSTLIDKIITLLTVKFAS